MTYDNRNYWPEMHERLKGQLRAVGHPYLSEELNHLKYASEAAGLAKAMHPIMDALRRDNPQKLSFLDVGAGTGFWTDLIFRTLSSAGYQIDVSALDVSEAALDVIRERLPYVRALQGDLADISPETFSNAFDVVSSCYCFHHIVRTGGFINALQFAGSSVKAGGFLLIMDPVLTRPYSEFDTFDLYSFRGNGVPRHLYFIDDVLLGCGLRRIAMYPAVSFLLNGCIEAGTSMGYFTMSNLWKLLCVSYRSDRFVRGAARILEVGDRILKDRNFAFSSSLCLYQKEDASVGG